MLLGDGTVLALDEMKKQRQLFEGVELLVLSGGDTAATRPDATGKEIDEFAELAQRLGARAVMATLWRVSDSSTPRLMRNFYALLESNREMTKAEALQQAQLKLLNATTEANPLPEITRSGGLSNVKVVIVSGESKQTHKSDGTTRVELVYLSEKNARPFKQEAGRPYAHPYYWAPFILSGNWK